MAPQVIVVGVGALGSHFLLIARNIPAQFRIIDMDRVERKNTKSQFHTNMAVGKNKADALKQAMQGLFGIKIDAIPHRLTADNVEQLLGDADLVVDCLDNAASRQIVQDFVRAREIPCLHGALDQNGQFGRACWTEAFLIDHEGASGLATCEDGQHLPFIVQTASCMALAVQKFLQSGRKVGYQIHPAGAIQV